MQAEKYLLEAIDLRIIAEKKIKAGIAASDTSLKFVPILYSCLADIYLHKGYKEIALKFALKGMEYYKYSRLMARVLYKSLLGRPVVDIIQIFDCLYDKKKDGDFLMEAIGWQATVEFAAYYYPIHDTRDKVKLYLKTKKYQGGVAVAGHQLDLLNHSALAEVFIKQENGEKNLPSVFAIMPSKYQKLAISREECQKDEDGRAAMRLIEQLKYYG